MYEKREGKDTHLWIELQETSGGIVAYVVRDRLSFVRVVDVLSVVVEAVDDIDAKRLVEYIENCRDSPQDFAQRECLANTV